jgi:hypothetical protein
MRSQCPSCDRIFQVDDKHAGLRVVCPRCKEKFILREVAEPAPPPPPRDPTEEFASLELPTAAVWTFGLALAAMSAAALVAGLTGLGLPEVDWLPGTELADLPLPMYVQLFHRLYQVLAAALAGSMVLWMHYAYRNLRALQAGRMSFSPAGAAVWPLVPPANLWFVPRIVSEIAAGSQPGRFGTDLINHSIVLRVWGWWIGVVASVAWVWVGAWRLTSATSPAGAARVAAAYQWAALPLIVMLVLTGLLVSRLSQWQTRRLEQARQRRHRQRLAEPEGREGEGDASQQPR